MEGKERNCANAVDNHPLTDIENPIMSIPKNNCKTSNNQNIIGNNRPKPHKKSSKKMKIECSTEGQSLRKHYFVATGFSIVLGITSFFLLKNSLFGVLKDLFLYGTLVAPILSFVLIFLWFKVMNLVSGSLQIIESVLFFVIGFKMLIETSSNSGKAKYFEDPVLYMQQHQCECWSIPEADDYCNVTSHLQKCEDQLMTSQLVATFTICVGFIIISIGLYIIIGTCLYYQSKNETGEDENKMSDQELI